jgi:hypothetical protein
MKDPHLQARLLRIISAHVDNDLPCPISIHISPKWGSVILQLADDQPGAVSAWARIVDADVVHDDQMFAGAGDLWHQFGTRVGEGSRSAVWHGWKVDLWCVVHGPAPKTAVA